MNGTNLQYCTQCGHLVAKVAPRCPGCGTPPDHLPPKDMRWAPRWVYWTCGGIAAFVMIGILSSPDKTPTSPPVENAAQPSGPVVSAETPKASTCIATEITYSTASQIEIAHEMTCEAGRASRAEGLTVEATHKYYGHLDDQIAARLVVSQDQVGAVMWSEMAESNDGRLLACPSYPNEGATPPELPTIFVSAVEISHEFDVNEVAANQLYEGRGEEESGYEGRLVEVTGQVFRAGNDMSNADDPMLRDSMTVIFWTNGSNSLPQLTFRDASKEFACTLAALRPRDTLGARCRYDGIVLKIIKLDFCEVTQYHSAPPDHSYR